MTPKARSPIAGEQLQQGRTDVYIGEVRIGWIFREKDMASINLDLEDGHISTLYGPTLAQCFEAIHRRLPPKTILLIVPPADRHPDKLGHLVSHVKNALLADFPGADMNISTSIPARKGVADSE